jgi:4'-phosphopantetheinyl transferase
MSCSGTVWHSPRGIYVLPPDEVHVWRASLDQVQGQIAGLVDLLSPEEQERAKRFHFETDRQRCILARGLLRLLLGHCLGRSANQLQFEYNDFGKPILAGGLHPSVQFNLSHSGDIVLIALSRGRALGVDIERMRMDVAAKEIAARFFSADECRALATVAPAARCAAFFDCWTRKEAYLKARGDGLSLPLAQFDVSFLPGDQPRLLAARHDPAEVHRWTLHALDGGEGYKAALAVEGGNWQLICWDWPAAPAAVRANDDAGVSVWRFRSPHPYCGESSMRTSEPKPH